MLHQINFFSGYYLSTVHKDYLPRESSRKSISSLISKPFQMELAFNLLQLVLSLPMHINFHSNHTKMRLRMSRSSMFLSSS